MHLLAERFIFWGVMIGFSERGSKDLSNGTNVASSLADFFFCIHVRSLWVSRKVSISRPSRNRIFDSWYDEEISKPHGFFILHPGRRGDDVRMNGPLGRVIHVVHDSNERIYNRTPSRLVSPVRVRRSGAFWFETLFQAELCFWLSLPTVYTAGSRIDIIIFYFTVWEPAREMRDPLPIMYRMILFKQFKATDLLPGVF